jgi:hypothetical protein
MKTITQEYLKSRLDYNPETGHFKWLPRSPNDFPNERAFKMFNTNFAWRKAGALMPSGRISIKLDGVRYRANKLAWLWVTGISTEEHIEHINGINHDNRWVNLREVAGSVLYHRVCLSRYSNVSGKAGVTPLPSGRYKARLTIGGKTISLVAFDSL